MTIADDRTWTAEDGPPDVPLLDDIPEAYQHTNGNTPASTAATPPDDDPAGFTARVAATRVDLIRLIRDGIPPRTFLPASDLMLIPGKRHYCPAPKKSGKSITTLTHSVDMVIAGATVAILDRENDSDEYARRLEGIITARNLDTATQDQLATRLRYYAYPRLRDKDGPELAAFFADTDLVVFDSQRTFLSTLGLKEDTSDDYAAFCEAALEPLSRAGTATLVLDNTGHAEPKRGRGSSAKGDLNEIIFTLETVKNLDLNTVGLVRLEIADSRFGTQGSWEMRIGGGTFGSWERVDTPTPPAATDPFRPTILMERVSRYLEEQPTEASLTTVEGTVTGHTKYVRVALDRLVHEAYVTERRGPRNSRLFTSKRPFRDDDPGHDPGHQISLNPGHDPDHNNPF